MQMKTVLMQGQNYCPRNSVPFAAVSTLIQSDDIFFLIIVNGWLVKQNCLCLGFLCSSEINNSE